MPPTDVGGSSRSSSAGASGDIKRSLSDTRAWFTDAAAHCRGSMELAPDLPNWLLEREDEFRASLGDDALLAYHCTRPR